MPSRILPRGRGMPAVAGIALALCLAAPARAEDPLWRALPFAEILRHDLAPLDDAALRKRAEDLRQRLFIDEQEIALERGEDLELVVGYAAAVTLLSERNPADTVGLAGARRSAAYLLHATGYLSETRPDLRIAIAELGALEDPAPRALATSVMAMRSFGRTAFEAAFEAGGTSAVALAQAGRIALREGEPLRAAERFMEAAAKETLPRFAFGACEALLAAGDAGAKALCERLEARFVATFPASAGRFRELRQDADDTLRSKEFAERRHDEDGSLGELSDEVWRRLRLGRDGGAEKLAERARERFPDDARAFALGIAVALEQGRDATRLLSEAERAGLAHEPAIRDAALAGLAQQAIARALGTAKGKAPERGALEREIDAYAARGGEPALTRELRVVAALASDDASRLGAALTELLRHGPDDGAVRLALVAALVSGHWEERSQGVLATLAQGPARDEAAALVARVELGLAIRTRDAERLDRAVAGLPAGDEPEIALTRIVARRAREVLAGRALEPASRAADRRALAALAFAFDEASRPGRLLAQARALTLATLEAPTADSPAAELLREARRFGGELGPLAGGAAQLLIGDARGALELCERGRSEEGALRQALLTCQALAAPEAEQRPLWALADDTWDAARLPLRLDPGTARPIFVGHMALEMHLGPDAPLALVVELAPVSLLVPELAPARAEVRRRAGR